MTRRFKDRATNRDQDRMSVSEVLTEIPWPHDWCFETLLNRIATRQEERQQ